MISTPYQFWKDFLFLRDSAGVLAVTASIEFVSQIILNKFSVVNGIIEYKLIFLADSIFQSSQFNQQRVSLLKSRKQHQLLNLIMLKNLTLENPDLSWRLFWALLFSVIKAQIVQKSLCINQVQ